MGVRQFYRGSPTNKEYFLVNDFSGGVNTTDVDDVIRDNEFRELLNVELGAKGMIQNRKGFGYFLILNSLTSNLISNGHCSLFKVLNDKNNLLLKMKAHGSNEISFYTDTQENAYDLEILLIIDTKVGLLKITKEAGVSLFTVNFTEKYDLQNLVFETITSYKRDILSIKTIDYADKVYFMLSDISEQLTGIGVWDGIAKSFSYIDNTNPYKPTPREVVSTTGLLGLNALATNPLTWVENTSSGVKTIYPPYLSLELVGAVATGELYVDAFPVFENFSLNVFYSGSAINPFELEIKFIDQNKQEVDYDLIATNTFSGRLVYLIQILDIENYSYLNVEVSKRQPRIELESTAKLTTYYGLSFGDRLHILSENKVYLKTNNRGYYLSDYAEEEIVSSATNADPETANPSVLFADYELPENYNKYFLIYNDSVSVLYSYTSSGWFSGGQIVRYQSWEDILPIKNQTIIKITTPESYYVRVGDTGGTITDFLKLTDYNEYEVINTVNNRFSVNPSVVSSPSKGINLQNAKMVEINKRMVLYKGNEIWFSELQKFDYFPQFAYVILPLQIGDEITNISYFRGSYVVFTKEKIYKLIGDIEESDFEVKLINDFIGCIAGNAVRSVENSLFFMSKQGLYRLYTNYYADGLENVSKVDTQIRGLIPITEQMSSLLYNGQYLLFLKDHEDFDTIKYYFNIDLPNNKKPFAFDKYRIKPEILTTYNSDVYSLKNGNFYIYDVGYTDFAPSSAHTEEALKDYLYTCKIKTSNLSFGLPTHAKKIKNIYIKTFAKDRVLLYLTVNVDEYEKISPYTATFSVNKLTGEVEYTYLLDDNKDSNLDLGLAYLGNFDLGFDPLGDSQSQVHKVVLSSKGKNVSIEIEQTSNGFFGITSIGYLYKVGKVKENR